jgi:hypothetical protein
VAVLLLKGIANATARNDTHGGTMQIRSPARASGRLLPIAAALLVLTATPAAADTFGFSCITGNFAADCAILEAQIVMDVSAGTDGTVNFLFTNIGPADSSVTAVYFDDLVPALLGSPGYITSSSGVSFSAGCAPPVLPGGSPYGFTTSYCADSDAPTQPLGVNPGEWLSIAYTLQGDATFEQVLAALYAGSYRVGIHVQGFAGGGSEAGINTPVARVSEPSALFMMGAGLLLVGWRVRRRTTERQS